MEASEEDIRAYILALKDNTEALGKVNDAPRKKKAANTDSMKEIGQAFKDLDNTIHTVTNQFSSAIKTIMGGADSLVAGFQSVARSIIGGAVIAEIVGAGYDLVKTYRQLADVGQTFGGSMFEMIKQSGEAGLPLAEFTRMLERNSIAAKSLEHQTDGSKMSLGLLAKSVRDTAEGQKMYGLSVAQLDDITGDYAEALRLSGRATNANKDTTTKQILSLANDITEFSDATGKSRNQILESMKEVMHTSAFAVASANMNAEQMKAHTTAIAALTALPGGTELANQLEETMAAGGAIYTEFGKKAAEAGVPEMIGVFDQMREKILGGHFDKRDAQDTLNQLQAMAKKSSLTFQAFAAQNPEARRMVDVLMKLNNVSFEELEKQQETANKYGKLTGFLQKLENQLNKLGAEFAEGFGESLVDLEKTFTDDGKSIFEPLKPIFKKLGTEMGSFIKGIITFVTNIKPETVTRFITVLGFGVDLLEKFGKGIGWVVDKLASVVEWIDKQFGEGTSASIVGFGAAALGAVVALTILGNIVRKLFSPIAAVGSLFGSVARRSRGRGNRGVHTTPHEPHTAGGASGRGGRLGAVGRFAGNLAGDLLGGGGDCCNNLLGGIDQLRDRVDFHGERAHTNARESVEAARPRGAAGESAIREPHLEAAGRSASAAEKAGVRAARTAEGMTGRIGGLARGALGAAEKSASFLAKSAMKIGRFGIAGGVGGLAAMGAEMAIDHLVPEGTRGKETAESMLEYGGQGAMLGSFAGPLGTAVGGALGAALGAGIANWSSISKGVGSLFGGGSTPASQTAQTAAATAATAAMPTPATARTQTVDPQSAGGIPPQTTTPAPAPATPSPQQPGAVDAAMPDHKDQTAAAVDKIAESTKQASDTSTANNAELLRQVQATNEFLSRILDFSGRHISVDLQNARTQQELQKKQIRTTEATQAAGS